MFATVECKDAPGGFTGLVRDIFTLPEITLTRVKIPCGEWFYRVAVTQYRGQIPVEETVHKLKRLRNSVLFDVNFPCDESTVMLEFSPSEFTAQLLFNTALDYIRKLDTEPAERSLCIFDYDGFYVNKLEAAVPLFSKIRVYTKNTASYEKVAAGLMEGYGIAVAVSDSFSGKAPECTAVICAGEVPFDNFFNGMLFTNAERVPACSVCIRGFGLDLPGEYELLRPSGIGRMYFAAALYEKGAVKSLGELKFKKLRLT